MLPHLACQFAADRQDLKLKIQTDTGSARGGVSLPEPMTSFMWS